MLNEEIYKDYYKIYWWKYQLVELNGNAFFWIVKLILKKCYVVLIKKSIDSIGIFILNIDSILMINMFKRWFYPLNKYLSNII